MEYSSLQLAEVRVTTPTRAGLCRYRWPPPRHAACLATLISD